MFGNVLIRSIACVFAVCWVCVLVCDEAPAQVLTSSPLQSGSSASATPVSPNSSVPSPVSIKQNMLLQQQASLNQAITVAKACIKNASLPQVLRDPQGNVNTVPNTDLVNCTRTLSALLNQLTANQKALSNLSQDAQFESMRFARLKAMADYAKRLKGGPMGR